MTVSYHTPPFPRKPKNEQPKNEPAAATSCGRRLGGTPRPTTGYPMWKPLGIQGGPPQGFRPTRTSLNLHYLKMTDVPSPKYSPKRVSKSVSPLKMTLDTRSAGAATGNDAVPPCAESRTHSAS